MCTIESRLPIKSFPSLRRRTFLPMKSSGTLTGNLSAGHRSIIITSSANKSGDLNGNSMHLLSNDAFCPNQLQPSMDSDDSAEKRVRFADAEGLDLVKIRELPVGSEDTPPDLTAVLCNPAPDSLIKSDTISSRAKFTIDFQQPVSDFARFMERIEKDKICLESAVIVDNKLVGTIKVKNLAYHKTVFVRLTHDSWRSHKNIEAHYVNNTISSAAAAAAAIDTFSFTYDLISSSKWSCATSVEFAICYRCQGSEFWDNNAGSNYCVSLDSKSVSSYQSANSNSSSFSHTDKRSYGANINWTEYAIWNHVADDMSPYW